MRYKSLVSAVIVTVSLLLSCATTAKTDKTADSAEKKFFRPNAEYYSRIDLKTLRPLVRDLLKELPSSQRLQVQMIAERTNVVLSYRMGGYLYSLLQGAFPKGVIDNLLLHHPEWLRLEDVDGFRHYSAKLEVGIPETNMLYATTENLKNAYEAPTKPLQDILPAYAVTAIEKNPFGLYYPQGNIVFVKDNPDFKGLPAFELLLTLTPLEGKLYSIRAVFTVLDSKAAGEFPAQMQSVINWYKTYYPEWAEILDALTMTANGRQVTFSAIYDSDTVVKLCTDSVSIAVTKLANSRYLSDSVTEEEISEQPDMIR